MWTQQPCGKQQIAQSSGIFVAVHMVDSVVVVTQVLLCMWWQLMPSWTQPAVHFHTHATN